MPIYDPLYAGRLHGEQHRRPLPLSLRLWPGYRHRARGDPVQLRRPPIDVIPAGSSPPLRKLQSSSTEHSRHGTGNNYTAPNPTGLINWSTTSRIDYVISSRDTFSVIGAVGRQASSVPVGQTTAGRNVGPVPYNYGQAYAPKTAVWTIEETHVFSPNLLNQVKWGYARYNGPTINPADARSIPQQRWACQGLPAGQATSMFPIVTFTGTNAPTQWDGATENRTTAANYTFAG